MPMSELMPESSENASAGLPIAVVERETGIPKDLLRQWERRYDFPKPLRDAAGDRRYALEDVQRLKLIRRLLDNGHRPGKLVALAMPQLQTMLESASPRLAISEATVGGDFLQVLQGHDALAVRQLLRHRLLELGLRRFVCEFLPAANLQIGEAWQQGLLQVYEEHLYAEELMRVMRETLATLPASVSAPRVMLTTCPGEQHTLGLLMVEALLRLSACDTIAFGAQMPLSEIASAAVNHRVDIIVLSFSQSYHGNVGKDLQTLRGSLPESVEIWLGGAGVPHARQWPSGCRQIARLEDVPQSVSDWRQQYGEV